MFRSPVAPLCPIAPFCRHRNDKCSSGKGLDRCREGLLDQKVTFAKGEPDFLQLGFWPYTSMFGMSLRERAVGTCS
jgi:hypothetical protein